MDNNAAKTQIKAIHKDYIGYLGSPITVAATYLLLTYFFTSTDAALITTITFIGPFGLFLGDAIRNTSGPLSGGGLATVGFLTLLVGIPACFLTVTYPVSTTVPVIPAFILQIAYTLITLYLVGWTLHTATVFGLPTLGILLAMSPELPSALKEAYHETKAILTVVLEPVTTRLKH